MGGLSRVMPAAPGLGRRGPCGEGQRWQLLPGGRAPATRQIRELGGRSAKARPPHGPRPLDPDGAARGSGRASLGLSRAAWAGCRSPRNTGLPFRVPGRPAVSRRASECQAVSLARSEGRGLHPSWFHSLLSSPSKSSCLQASCNGQGQ